ncbi:Transposable element Tc3 transposase [Anthophora retusa]
MTARQIAHSVGIDTNVKNVRRVLKKCKHLVRRKLQKKPWLNAQHKTIRLRFAEKHIHMSKKWRRVIFTDEKRFNLDGPDGLNYYYHDLRKEQQILSRRQMGGGGIMIWSGIGYYGKMDINFISGKLNSKKYLEMIDQQINAYATRIAGDKFIFQHDNAAVHTAKVVKAYFSSKNIRILDWPAKSPDLNIIENCWGNLARAVYKNGGVGKLNTEKYKKKMYKSLPNRMLAVINSKGGATKY